MKRILVLLVLVVVLSSSVLAKPFYIGCRIGFPAKFQITLGDCSDGWGVCLSFKPTDGPTNYFAGYDSDTDNIYVKISKSDPAIGKGFPNPVVIREDSPVDPKLIKSMTNFPKQGKQVFIKAGSYKVVEEGTFLIIAFDYYIR